MFNYRNRIYGHYVASSSTTTNLASLEDLECRRPTMEYVVDNFFPQDKAATIIDLGCGHGTLIHFARKRGYKAICGFDVSPQQVELATRLGIEGISEGNLFTSLAGLSAESTDAIVTFDVIEHFTKNELIDFVDEVRRVLKKGGRWIIHAPNGASPFAGTIRYGDFTHEQAFTKSSLEQVMYASGFTHIDCHECSPRIHGFRSSLRVALWYAIRQFFRLINAAETGETRSDILLTRNLYAVVWK